MAEETQSIPQGNDLPCSPAILVTGGAGYVGSKLVKYFSDKGDTVVSIYRNRLVEPWENVYPVCSDLTSEGLLAAPLRGVNTVVHLAWDDSFIGCDASDGAMQQGKENLSKNNTLLKNLLNAMEKAKTTRIIFVSALGVDKKAEDGFLKEKYVGEFLVLNSSIPEKIILRPSVVFGGDENRDRFTNAIKRIMRLPFFYPLPSWKKKISPVYIEDLVKCIEELAKKKLEHPISVINIEGGVAYKIDEICKLFSEHEEKRTQVALGSVLGKVLLPLVEREHKNDRQALKIKRFLLLSKTDEGELLDASVNADYHAASRSLKEAMTEKNKKGL